MTVQPRFRLLFAVLAAAWAPTLLLLFLIRAGQPVYAQNESAGVQPLGSISGRVTDTAGAPLRGIRVDFYGNVGQQIVRSTTTDAGGRYHAPLVTQLYRVRFTDPAGVYALQFYSGALTLQTAQDLSVAGNQVEHIDAQLGRAGTITGVVHVSARANHLMAFAWIDGEWQAVQEATGWPEYAIIGLPAGRYRVCFTNPIVTSEDVVPCYKEVVSGVDDAADITVAAGAVITGIDLFGDSATTIDIDGTFPYTVAIPHGGNGGIAGKITDLPPYDPSSYQSVTIFTLAGGQWRIVKVVDLDAAHRYQVTNLPPGTYRACLAFHGFTGEDGPCYDHIRRGVQWATDINVTEGKVTTADLPTRDFVDGAAISGTITNEGGAPLADVQVYLERWIGPQWLGPLAGWYGAAYPHTDAAGVYQIGDLLPGEYLIGLWDLSGQYIPSWADSGITQTVTLGRMEQRSGVDLHMVPGGVISGVISFAGPYPPAAASVIAETQVEGIAVDVRGEYDPDSGVYAIKQLIPGVYRVRAEVPSPYGGWSSYTGYYGASTDPGASTAITVTKGSRTGGIDIRVAAGIYDGVLTGTMISQEGQPLAGIRVELYLGSYDPDHQRTFVFTFTDESGSYRFGGLMSGYSYTLRYSDPAGGYLPVYAYSQSQYSNVYGFITLNGQTDEPVDVQVLPAPFVSPLPRP